MHLTTRMTSALATTEGSEKASGLSACYLSFHLSESIKFFHQQMNCRGRILIVGILARIVLQQS